MEAVSDVKQRDARQCCRSRQPSSGRADRDAATHTGRGGTTARVSGERPTAPPLSDPCRDDGRPTWPTARPALDGCGPYRGVISIQRAAVEGPDGPVLVPTKTPRSCRVALDHASCQLLRDHYVRGVAEGGVNGIEQRFLFAVDDTGACPWLPNFVTKRFIHVRRAAGLGHFRLHDLCHFMATEMLDAGVPVRIVAARLAHARASTTLNVYAHAVPGGGSDRSRSVVEKGRRSWGEMSVSKS
jgi:hypothetical protein